MPRRADADRRWCDEAVHRIEADYTRSADTHLLRVQIPGLPQQPLYFKDESVHPTGSLKHRLARSLFLYGLCNGLIGPRSHDRRGVVGLDRGIRSLFRATDRRALRRGDAALDFTREDRADRVSRRPRPSGRRAAAVYAEAARWQRTGGHYMDQFTYAERATDWRGNNNIAESIFAQMRPNRSRFRPGSWSVQAPAAPVRPSVATSVLRQYATRICLADPENSVFHDYWASGDATLRSAGSRIEGIGRPRVEPSFNRHVVDRSIRVADELSFAAARFLEGVLGRKVGPSTGTALIACAELLSEMKRGATGAVVTLLCDGGERYLDTCYDDDWLHRKDSTSDPDWRRSTLLAHRAMEKSAPSQDLKQL